MFIPSSKPKNKTSDENQQPSNCRDLNNLGHTLSGFFLVNKNKPATNTVKLHAIYCDFTRPMFTSSGNNKLYIVKILFKIDNPYSIRTKNRIT